MNYDKLLIICTQFREALEKDVDDYPVIMGSFPLGCCGVVSRALGGYLMEIGYKSVEYVSGFSNKKSHAWIEIDDWIVDITADQFNDCDERIIITKDRSFHSKFLTNKTRRPCSINDLNNYPESWIYSISVKK
jgi:hypothetical protein